MPDSLYVLGDADRIRRRIEGMLLSNDLKTLQDFSTAITTSIQKLGDRMRYAMSAKLIFSGGDDILLLVQPEIFNQDQLRGMMKEFAEETGSTISIGVGTGAEEAFLNLARAKSTGPGTLIVGQWHGKTG